GFQADHDQRCIVGSRKNEHPPRTPLARPGHHRTHKRPTESPTAPMAGSPLKPARREQREANQLATYETTRRTPRPAARDTPADYAPSQSDEVLALSDEGYSLAEIAARWSTSEETIEQWRKAHSEFDEALNRARAREKAWWLARARKAIRDDNNRF